MNSNEEATREADRLRKELDKLRARAAELAELAEGREAALRHVGERHAQQLKDAYELGRSEACDDELAQLRSELSERDALLKTILGSLSWRLTRPLRGAKRLACRLVSLRGRVRAGDDPQ